MKKTYTILAVLGVIALLLTCEKFEVSPLTKLKTISATPNLRTITARGKILELSKKDHSEYGFAYGPMQYPLVADGNVILDDAVVGEYTAVIEGLDMGQQYYIRAFCLDGDKYVYGEPVAATTFAVTVTTVNPTEIISTAATSGGSISVNGTITISARGVCWKTTANPTVLDSRTTDGSGDGSFSSRLNGLTANTAYYVRAYALTPTDTIYGNEINFSTNNLTTPSVTNGTISQITPTSATCTAEVTSDGGLAVTERGVCWKVSANPTVDGTHASNGEGTGIFSVNISGLTPNTTYYYRVYAINSVGTTYGQEQTFKTAVALPTVQTTSITNIGVTTATGGGNVTGNGNGSVSAKGICWSENLNPTINNEKTIDGSGIGTFTSTLTSLSSYTTYYVRAYATNEAGTAYGDQVSFTTLHQVELPTISTSVVSAISYTTATCGGNVTNDGYGVVTARGLCWSAINNHPTTSDSKTDNGSGTGSFVGELTDLTPNTKYYVRAYAINSAGTGYGNTLEFTTLAMAVPSLLTTAVSAITATSATSGGSITSNGGSAVTMSGICWSTATNPTIALGTKTTNGTLTGSFTGSMTDLQPNTTYYVRAYATNGVGTGYGNELQFSTNNLAIGDTYQGGIVFYIDGTGQNGLVCAPTDQSTNAVWGCYGTTITGADGTGIGTGVQNTVDIEAGCTTSGTAADVCANLNLNGYTDWFLPSMDELNLMYTNLKVAGLGNFSNSNYYSSSEYSEYAAYRQDFQTGSQGFISKEYTHYVRAVRGFGNILPIPSITTSAVSNITQTTATCGGNVTSQGGSSVTVRGVVWSTSQNPTVVLNTKTEDGQGTGEFTSNITGLTPSATYYVRAYATNSVGTAYGSEVSFSTLPEIVLATVTTAAASNITSATAKCGGEVTSEGKGTVSERGICWGTSANPTIAGSHTASGSGLGAFTVDITGLTENTTYHIRAYATNEAGTAYGSDVSFTTPITVSDVDGNIYKAVTIGTQVWMAENLKTTRLNDGSAIPLVTLASEWKNLSTPAYCWYDNTIGYKEYYGVLYNWYVVETGKLCPFGWHVPSDWEWKELEMFLGMTLAEADQTGWRGSGIGTMLKSTSGWSTNGTNTSGFTGLPGGDRSGADGAFNYVTEYGYWWSTSPGSLTNYSMMRDLGNVSTVGRYSYSNKMGLSVRCLKGTVETVPIVTTNSISSITANSSVCGGNVSADGGASVTARGVCWSTSQNPTIDLTTKTVDGSGIGTFTSSITGLTPGTTYYVRAYASNSVGTAYGEEVNFTTAVTAIGETYAGGIVFYLDETGQHGLVCAPSDQSTGAPWGCQGTNLPGADGTAVGTGAQNTIDIENGCTTTGTAADICANLSLNGYTDWFFPSKDELNLMYTNLKLNGIGNFTESWYSSSSEYSANNVWEQNFSTGTQATMYGQLNNKGLIRYVRAARAF